ncbi:hypothetical protein FRB94_005046 [Tulasnella sp. JGI-2019a]|nr:hypothetical protein FRB94_005046 [Tulasnella sp. JGI-2019a]
MSDDPASSGLSLNPQGRAEGPLARSTLLPSPTIIGWPNPYTATTTITWLGTKDPISTPCDTAAQRPRAPCASMDLHQLNGSLSIPDELLTRIFQFTLSGFWCINRCGQENIKNGATYYDELSLLRGVCVIWRELIDSSPGFWALVESTVPNIEACLAKSRNVPITIALRLTGSNQLGLVNWERGLEVISRGETANIEYYLEEDWADAEISALKASCAPMLQEICLSDCIQRVPDRIAIDLFCLLAKISYVVSIDGPSPTEWVSRYPRRPLDKDIPIHAFWFLVHQPLRVGRD